MRTLLKLNYLLLFFVLFSCQTDTSVKFYLDTFDSDKYYSEEIIPANYLTIYGKWKLYEISGGFHGSGYEPDYDYLEIKTAGIYGLIRNDSLLEYGKIVVETFDNNTTDFLQVKLMPDDYVGRNPHMAPPEKYIELISTDTLNLISPCCDMYNYHYKRVK